MPTYQYECKKCGLNFEEKHSIKDRNIPCNIIPNPLCDVYIAPHKGKAECKVEVVLQSPAIVSMRDGWQRHTDDGWKDRLRQIKRDHPGSDIDV